MLKHLTSVAIAMILILGVASLALGAGDTLNVYLLDCQFKTAVDTGVVYLDSAGTRIDTAYASSGSCDDLIVFPDVEYNITVDIQPHVNYEDVDTGYYKYGETDSTNVYVSVCVAQKHPAVVVFNTTADPLLGPLDTMIVTWTTTNGADTVACDTTNDAGTAFLPAWDSLTVGTTYRCYLTDQAGSYNGRYWSMPWDTFGVFALKTEYVPLLTLDTLTIHVVDPSTGLAPTSTKTLTAKFIGMSNSARAVADTSASLYWVPINSNQTVTVDSDGYCRFIQPQGSCWTIKLANTTLLSEFVCIDSSWVAQTWSGKN